MPAKDHFTKALLIINQSLTDALITDECIYCIILLFYSTKFLRVIKCCRSSSFCCRDSNIPLCLHCVYSLVAVIPGVQLFVPGMVVDAAVAGVALWEEYHRALIAADGAHRKENVSSCESQQTCFLVCTCGIEYVFVCNSTCGWCRGCRRDTVRWSVHRSACCRPHRGSHILRRLPQHHGFYTAYPRCILLPKILR